MEKIEIKSEYIKLDQFLKWAGIFAMGSDAKEFMHELQKLFNMITEDFKDIIDSKLLKNSYFTIKKYGSTSPP